MLSVPFRDRCEAGRGLAEAVLDLGVLGEDDEPVVVGLARGGVEVAAEVANVLRAPLDALAVRKIRHPWQPEYGLGAVAPGGVTYLRARDGLSEEQVAAAVADAATAVEALDARVHESHGAVPVDGTTCVLVDDGLATGGTMVAGARWARVQGARRIVVAVPVGAAATVHRFEQDVDVDAVVCPVTPIDFGAVGLWYDDFHQVSEDDVRALLAAGTRGAVGI